MTTWEANTIIEELRKTRLRRFPLIFHAAAWVIVIAGVVLAVDSLLHCLDVQARVSQAKLLADFGKWTASFDKAGFAIELIPKARICSEQNIAAYPENVAEANAMNLKDYFTHDREK